MAETIYSIPINESFDEKCGCPLCRLHCDHEQSALDYILGAAMMEPDIRQETNRLGFCRRHSEKMYSMKNRLALSLTLQTRLRRIMELFSAEGEGGRALFGRKTASDDPLFSAADDCFVCRRIAGFDDKICSNTIYLWKTDSAFRDKFHAQPYFCLDHASALLRAASAGLSKAQYAEFRQELSGICLRHAAELDDALSGFIASFDHRNASVPLTDEQRAAAHDSIEFLSGCAL